MALLRVSQMGKFEILKKSYIKERLSLKAVIESRLWACTLSFVLYLFALYLFNSLATLHTKSMLKKKKLRRLRSLMDRGRGLQTQQQICMESHKPRVTATKPADQRDERSRRYGYSTLTFECQK